MAGQFFSTMRLVNKGRLMCDYKESGMQILIGSWLK
jgi:hypothetical protein